MAEQDIVEIEDVSYKSPQTPGSYVDERDEEHDEGWREWLQTHRVELNAFTTPDFIEWLDQKMASFTKLVPPNPVMADRLGDQIRQRVRDSVVAKVLSEARIEDRVDQAMAALNGRITGAAVELPDRVRQALQSEPKKPWTEIVDREAVNVAKAAT